MQLICYKNCSTCKRVEKKLKEKEISFIYREISEDNPSAKELSIWIKQNGQPVTKWMNTSGQKYRQLKISQKRKELSQEDLLDLLATDGMLVKRPILLADKLILVGPQVEKWIEQQ